MFRASLRHLLAVPPSVLKDVYGVDVGAGFDVVGEAGSVEEVVAIVRSAKPDVLLLDLSMPRLSGLDALRELHTLKEAPRTLVLSGQIDRTALLATIQCGATALVPKAATTEAFLEALVAVIAGRHWIDRALIGDLIESVRGLGHQQSRTKHPGGLTRRERQVLELVVNGYPNKEIGRTLGVAEETVKHHLTRMFDKADVSNRLELAMWATGAVS
jgi:DNA-binding NarL/FixJ family response regulator